jgi:hypothetical protein
MIYFIRVGGVWESNPPTGGLTRSTGFEVQGPHQQPNASRADILEAHAMVVKGNLVHYARKCAREPVTPSRGAPHRGCASSDARGAPS